MLFGVLSDLMVRLCRLAALHSFIFSPDFGLRSACQLSGAQWLCRAWGCKVQKIAAADLAQCDLAGNAEFSKQVCQACTLALDGGDKGYLLRFLLSACPERVHTRHMGVAVSYRLDIESVCRHSATAQHKWKF